MKKYQRTDFVFIGPGFLTNEIRDVEIANIDASLPKRGDPFTHEGKDYEVIATTYSKTANTAIAYLSDAVKA